MAAKTTRNAEFSRPFAVEGLGESEVVETIEATAGERAVLAERFDLLALERLSARLRLVRLAGQPLVRVSGDFEADLVQACVVTLGPVPARLAERFSLLFSLAPEPVATGGEIFVDVDAEEPPEPIPPGGLDLGEILAEQLALALDPYPRAAGARLEQADWGESGDRGPDAKNPFAVLKSLKKS